MNFSFFIFNDFNSNLTYPFTLLLRKIDLTTLTYNYYLVYLLARIGAIGKEWQACQGKEGAQAKGDARAKQFESRGIQHVQQRSPHSAQELEEASAQGANAGRERSEQLQQPHECRAADGHKASHLEHWDAARWQRWRILFGS